MPFFLPCILENTYGKLIIHSICINSHRNLHIHTDLLIGKQTLTETERKKKIEEKNVDSMISLRPKAETGKNTKDINLLDIKFNPPQWTDYQPYPLT